MFLAGYKHKYIAMKKKHKVKSNIEDLKNIIKSLSPKRKLDISAKKKKKYDDEDLDDAIVIIDD